MKEEKDEELDGDDLPLDEEDPVCPNCGQSTEGETTCPYCGAILANEEEDEVDDWRDDDKV